MIRLIKQILKRVGLEVSRSNLYTCHDLRFVKYLVDHEVDTVLDVGANRGQFALELLRNGYRGRIISFEPLPQIYQALQNSAKRYADRWAIAPRCALSDRAETAEFHVTTNRVGSSLLKPANILLGAAPSFVEAEKVEVQCLPLDAIVQEFDLDRARTFLKIDVQGGEKKVLDGAGEILAEVVGVLIEMSIRPLYEGQSVAGEIESWLTRIGFELWDILPGYREPATGRLEQYDAVYFRAPASKTGTSGT